MSWCDNPWYQGVTCICCVLVSVFTGLATFRFETANTISIIFFVICLGLSIVVGKGLPDWGNVICGLVLLILNLVFLIILWIQNGFSDAVLMLILSTVAAGVITVCSFLCE